MKLVLIGIALAVVGCDRKESTSGSATVAPKATGGAATAPAAAATMPSSPATGAMLQKLGDKEGLVFAETKGGMVHGIADGTRIQIVAEDEPMAGASEDLFVTVKHGGKDVKLPAASVMTEGALKRSPDGKHAVFEATTSCGDLCHTVFWLISNDGRRTKLGEGGVSSNIAWHPASTTVAVSSGGTWLVDLPDYKVTLIEEYMSPSYAPDGTLYLRNGDGAAFTYAAGSKPVRVWKPKKKRKIEDDIAAEEEPSPVRFVGGKPKFELEN